MRPFCLIVAAASVSAAALGPLARAANLAGYTQTNLVSNINGLALNHDDNLQNPWGISLSGGSFFWVSDNARGVSTLYNGAGTPQSLVVTIPRIGGGTSAPTGTVFNGSAGSGAFGGDVFLFATEEGTLCGWRNALGTSAEIIADSSGSGANFKGLAIGTVSGNTYAYAADFHHNQIQVFSGTGGQPALTGNFTDPALPAGFSPFNIQNLGGKLYVAYAQKDANSDEEVPGPGLGLVNIFDLNGNFLQRLVSNGALNAPWGLALTPAGWGLPAGDVLVGNFGDGTINAYDPSGALVGTIADVNGTPIVNSGLWGITFGNGGNGGSPTSLYVAAGIHDEQDGLFARIDVPEPAALAVLAFAGVSALSRRGRR